MVDERFLKKQLGSNIKKFRELKGLKSIELIYMLNSRYGFQLDRSNVSRWEQGAYSPTIEVLKAISEILDVSINKLYGEESYENNSKDLELLNDIEKLDLRQKQTLKNIIKAQLGFKSDEKIRTLKLFAQAACAGNGNFADNEDYELVEFANPPITATFCVKVQGDSMEPKIDDNQIVFVRDKVDLQNGDVGIFFYQGNVLCKAVKHINGKLILSSYNKKYKDIIIENRDELYVIGRVL